MSTDLHLPRVGDLAASLDEVDVVCCAQLFQRLLRSPRRESFTAAAVRARCEVPLHAARTNSRVLLWQHSFLDRLDQPALLADADAWYDHATSAARACAWAQLVEDVLVDPDVSDELAVSLAPLLLPLEEFAALTAFQADHPEHALVLHTLLIEAPGVAVAELVETALLLVAEIS